MSDRKTIQLEGGKYDGRIFEVKNINAIEMTTMAIGEALVAARDGETVGTRFDKETAKYQASGRFKDDGTEYFTEVADE